MKNVIQTYNGVLFDLLNPTLSMINAEDIAHSLSMQPRFNGHLTCNWTVAHHSLVVSDLSAKSNRLLALLHDAAEAYIGDIVAPLKEIIPDISEIEYPIQQVIFVYFGASDTPKAWEETMSIDTICAYAEANSLFMDQSDYWQNRIAKLNNTDFAKYTEALRLINKYRGLPPEQIRDAYYYRLIALWENKA